MDIPFYLASRMDILEDRNLLDAGIKKLGSERVFPLALNILLYSILNYWFSFRFKICITWKQYILPQLKPLDVEL